MAACVAATATADIASGQMVSAPAPVAAAPVPASSVSGAINNRGRILKSVKWGMIETGGSALEKFQLCKELGFYGMELNSPVDVPTAELVAASAATGMPIHGLVDMKHWDFRISSPDKATRDEGRKFLEQGIRDSHAMGGHTVLLVPGRVSGADETHDDVWNRSIAEIRKVLPLASHLGVRVLIENVWNGFCETPEQLRDYLDEIASPWVGSYFDIGNVQKLSPPANWIRVLGSRIAKLDVKDWDEAGRDINGGFGGFCKIGDGSVDWPGVREALAEVNYSGWCTAEVTGGGRERLADIAQRMDLALGL